MMGAVLRFRVRVKCCKNSFNTKFNLTSVPNIRLSKVVHYLYCFNGLNRKTKQDRKCFLQIKYSDQSRQCVTVSYMTLH